MLWYWVARSSRAMTARHWNQKASLRARRCESRSPRWMPGRSEAPPGLERYFFFDFLAFFAFFAFFAFLAIASSQGLMDGNATRGMLGGGPASQYPQSQSQQIRRPLPRTVTLLSLRYPQLLCVFGAFCRLRSARRHKKSRCGSDRAGSAGLTSCQRRGAFCVYRETIARAGDDLHQFKTKEPIAARR